MEDEPDEFDPGFRRDVPCDARVGDMVFTPREKRIIVVTKGGTLSSEVDGIVIFFDEIERAGGMWMIGELVAR